MNATAKRRLPRSAGIWALYVVGLMPAAIWFYLGATGQIPGNSIKEFEHALGLWALRFLFLTLAITPLRDLAGVNLVRYRRALGLLAFWYVAMHFATYMLLDQRLDMPAILTDIAKRPFITIGMAGLLMLLPLALTSNNWSIRRLGPRWNRLHKLVYVIVLAGVLHFAMSVKVITAEPFIYITIAILLVAYRLARPTIMQRRRGSRRGPVSNPG